VPATVLPYTGNILATMLKSFQHGGSVEGAGWGFLFATALPRIFNDMLVIGRGFATRACEESYRLQCGK
jgi:hypothetical protein